MISNKWAEALQEGAILVTVNQRLARYYVREYQCWQERRGASWWETPNILPWQSWLAGMHADAMAHGHTDHLLLPGLVQQRLWRQCLTADNALSPLLDMDAAAANAQRAWVTAHHWDCLEVDSASSLVSADQQAFGRWAKFYSSRRQKDKLLDDATLADYLLNLLENSPEAFNLPPVLLLAGFLSETPQQQVLLDSMESSGVTVRRLLPERKAQVHVHLHADDDNELLSIATQIRTLLADGGDGLLFGLVVPNLQQRRGAVLRFFDQVFYPGLNPDEINKRGRPYDISLGLPLSEQSVVRTALLLLRLCIGQIDSTQVSSLLLSPYLVAADHESRMRGRLDRKLREKRVRTLTLRALIKELDGGQELRRSLEKLLSIKVPANAGSAQWAVVFGNMLEAAGWPGGANDSEEYQTIQAWHTCLDDLQVLDDGEQITAKDALKLLHRLSTERVFQPEVSTTPIQIMGRLESHGIQFDQLWIAGLDADQWPPPGSPSPFLSIAKQKSAGVPEASVDARLAIAEDEFKLWSASANVLDVSFAMSRDGNALAPAAVIAELPLDDGGWSDMNVIATDSAVELKMNSPAKLISQSTRLESVSDAYGPAVDEGSAVRGGARLLENQARCPFKAFALHRLHIRPLEEPGMGLDARQHGTLLHLALELFWKKHRTHAALMAMDDDTLEAELTAVIDEALLEETLNDTLQLLEQRRLQRLLREWLLSCEKPREPFEVIAFEETREVQREGVLMTLQVDRIDKLDSGHTVVLDYKTGTGNSRKSWSELRIESPQLPLYALSDSSIDGVCFAQVARHKHRFLGVASDDGLINGVNSKDGEIESWPQWRAHWQSSIDTVAREVREGLASVTPVAKACDFCDIKPLCRVDAQEPEETDDAAG